MSTPEHPATPPLTRKQMRELRNTGSTPVITAAPATDEPAVDPTPQPPASSAPAAPPLPRPAPPAVIPPPPVADAAVDLGVSPLTRRQARQQEKIRTASVPVITPEVVAAHAAAAGARPVFDVPPAVPAPEQEDAVFTAAAADDAPVPTDSGIHALFGIPRTDEAEHEPSSSWASPDDSQPAAAGSDDGAPAFAASASEEPAADAAPALAEDEETPPGAAFGLSAEEPQGEHEQPKAVVNPLFGAGLLSGDPIAADPVVSAELPPSFDQLLTRSTGSMAAPNALIVSQAPEVAPLVGPVTATGEVLVTGTFNLPEGLGSTGHAVGTADGKEIDATLVDGELPSHSSPTPIAASAAVSTVKTPGEVIRPPVPEKGSKLMMSLAITAGVLAIALVGVLILAFATGTL